MSSRLFDALCMVWIMQGFNLITLNTNGLRLAPKWRAIFSRFRTLKADIIMLQETHSMSNDEKIWLAEWGGNGVFSHGRSNSKGVSILFSRGLDISITKTIKGTEGRFLILQLLKGKDKITLVNVYAPTGNEANNQTLLLGKIRETLAELEIHNLFIGGDFNVKMDDLNPPSTRTPTRDTYIAQINVLLNDYSLVDAWKSKNPTSKRGTFHRNTYSARLDYLFRPWLSPSIVVIYPHSCRASVRPLYCLHGCQYSLSFKGPGFLAFSKSSSQRQKLLRTNDQPSKADPPGGP